MIRPVHDSLSDTAAEAAAVHEDLLRRALPERRLALALSLSASVIDMARAHVRRTLGPGTSAREVRLALVAGSCGQDPRADLRRYLAARDE